MSNDKDIITEIANVYQNEILTEAKKKSKDGKLDGAEKLNKTDGDSTENVKKLIKVKEIDAANKSTAKDCNESTKKENKENKGMVNESKFDQLFNKAKASILNEEDVNIEENPDEAVDAMSETDTDVPPITDEEGMEGEEDEVDIADALQEITDRLMEIVSDLRGEEEGEELADEELADEEAPITDEGSIGESVGYIGKGNKTIKKLAPGKHKKFMSKKQKADSDINTTSNKTGELNKAHLTKPTKVGSGWSKLQKGQTVSSKITPGKRITD